MNIPKSLRLTNNHLLEERLQDKRLKMEQIRQMNREEMIKQCDLQGELITQQLQ